MKLLKYSAVLFSFVLLLLVGCSDKTQSPVAPSEQSLNQPISLEKNFTRDFTAIGIPTGIYNEPIYKYPDGKKLALHYLGPVQLTAAFADGLTDLLSGTGEIEIMGIQDQVTGIGHFEGKLTITPDNAEGGVWKITFHGKPSYSPTAWEGGPGWVLPLKELGHGNGGTINGMQLVWENTVVGPLDWSIWAGSGPGNITSH
jgi:hypothetical protein